MSIENDDQTKKNLDQALTAGDEWLRKQGVVTDFSINTIIAWIYVNFEKVQNVEMDVDKQKQRIYVRIYLNFWVLFLMTIFRQKEEFLDAVFSWLMEYLPNYEISVELKRHRGIKAKFVVEKPIEPEIEVDSDEDPSKNIVEALKAKKPSTEPS